MIHQPTLGFEDDEQRIEDATDDDVVVPVHYSITSYGADYVVDGLVKRLRDDSIFVPPFQRGFVWDLKKASRFIESLLLGLPVPGIFLSREEGSQKLLVIDGQQRLLTLRYFYDGVFPDTHREFGLHGVQHPYEGVTYATLSDEDRRLLDDSILHATVVRQDEPSDDNSSVYQIFERLNTGGILLQPQEIRSSINHGPFSDLLKQLNTNRSWRTIYGPESKKMRDQELILRFVALYFRSGSYSKPMKEFLNGYMAANRYFKVDSAEVIRARFETTIALAYECFGNRAFKPLKVLNAAVFDAVMIGLARRLEHGPIQDIHTVKRQYDMLNGSEPFSAATQTATTDEENVKKRIKLAVSAFEQVR